MDGSALSLILSIGVSALLLGLLDIGGQASRGSAAGPRLRTWTSTLSPAQAVIDDEIGGFPDLPLARLAVADQDVDSPIEAVEPCRQSQAGGNA